MSFHPLTDQLSLNAGPRSPSGAGPVTVVLGRFGVLVGRGLAQILGENHEFRVVGVDLDCSALEHTIARRVPQVAILDEPPAASAIVLDRLRSTYPATGILILAHRPSLAYGMRLLATGVSCISKDSSAPNILAAVRVAADGRRVYATDDGHLVERGVPDATVTLTPRETEVLEFLSRARSHAEIAHALNVGVETIRTHSAHIRHKLGVSSNRELVGLKLPPAGL